MILGESLEKLDRRLFVASLIGAVLVGALLLRDDLLVRYMKAGGTGETIGRVIAAKNDVRRRHSQSLTWYKAFDNETIKERDSLFTGNDSELTIELRGERRLSLDPNSLVVMHTRGSEVLLDLQLGAVASFAQRDQTIKIINEGQVTTIKADKKAAPVIIKKNPKGSLTILSRTGDVEVGVGNKKAKVRKNEPLVVDKTLSALKEEPVLQPEVIEEPSAPYGPEKPPPLAKGVLPQPVRSEHKVVLKFKDGVNVRSPASVSKSLLNPPILEWKPVENAREYGLEISKDDKFKNPLLYDPLDTTRMVWRDVEPGEYYWRVKARGFHEDEVLMEKLAKLTVELPSPKVSVPSLKDEVTDRPDTLNEEKEVEIKWTEVPMAKGYRFMASVDGKTLENTVTKNPAMSLQVPPNESVVVKVAAVDEKGRQIGSIAEESLSFKRKLQIKPPRVRLPNDKAIIVAFDKKKIAPLLFTWENHASAEAYELQFASDPDFKNIVAEKTVKENQFILRESLSDTETYWRVRSRLKGHESAWSKPRSYEIKSGSQ